MNEQVNNLMEYLQYWYFTNEETEAEQGCEESPIW